VLGSSLGNYRVVQQLGAGGMGVVYVGHREALGRCVVIKVLQPELCNDADMVQRFFNEARRDRDPQPGHRAGVRLRVHRRPPRLLRDGAPGGRVARAGSKRWRCDFAECCRLGRHVANVLQAAHAAGIIHRDLSRPTCS
jgi:serine/threonine protein kinase